MVWDAVGGTYRRFSRFPDPTRNMVSDIRVLACEDTFQAKITMYGEAAMHWAWSVFVPQPTEIVRKTLTGGYKCGFYLGLKVKSPIDLIPGTVFEAPNIYGRPFLKVSEVFAEIARPAVTGLFYMWAAGSAFEALSTWQSLVYAAEMCDLQQNECLLADGIGTIATLNGIGEPNQYVVLYDPNGWHPNFSGFIHVPAACWLQVDAVGTLDMGGATATHFDVYINGIPAGGQQSLVHLGALAPGGHAEWSLSWGGFVNPTDVAVEFNCNVTAPPLAHATFVCKRFTVTESPTPRQNPCIVWQPPDP